ncbi:hypothetical protein PR048_016370 [Dryococelus australis]|uniref:Mutator-like transposase domain-containing protein n=1 Tax=Dryococelus australis TaxID=614101 RepID=A0ABQ9HKP6_9NEOP|nr:hypothetical protein PR048_016370 [Dryococelus australis]
MDVNTAAVSGTISSGGGRSQLEGVFSAMYVPVLSSKTFHKYRNIVCDAWEATSSEETQTAALEEARLAKEKGEVDSVGIPTIMVVADCCWSKHSYITNHTALSRVSTHSPSSAASAGSTLQTQLRESAGSLLPGPRPEETTRHWEVRPTVVTAQRELLMGHSISLRGPRSPPPKRWVRTLFTRLSRHYDCPAFDG